MPTRNSCLSKLDRGSAAYVVAHARWRRSRGRGPSMSYLTERNPRKALASAQAILVKIGRRQKREEILQYLPPTTPKETAMMDHVEIEAHIRRIVIQCMSGAELAQRLFDELGLGEVSIKWYVPVDQTGVEARDLASAFGGLVSKSGALVSVRHGL